ncbi:peptide-methionine (S)-S-oxide reductase MsrA [Cupriavidus malaysiensis]|uniref:Peptide methionine sulfoxide reductase MsrA n=1 Tax=Cupriavidus malaysiensis TaxID=367825 RepID=A0ABM6F6V2_9BURK|nr:peptide-methionine (S)-S-oxide reductase MsrA [Cupriavidus malaysiensis]AOZ07257.1 peptide-methionine (S)-S-oxide reductase [Cupriavidus malaysiensis]
MENGLEIATLGGGCFWCLEAVYQQVRGVKAVESGYSGGHLRQPSYEEVCSGDSGHAEVVRVSFDPSVVTYREILEIFFAIHDPTTLNRQGNDVGTQYRSVIFTHSQAQRATAEHVLHELEAGKVFDAPIVTQVEPEQPYWRAEDGHQNYYQDHPGQGYCAVVISPKLAKFRARFAELLRR